MTTGHRPSETPQQQQQQQQQPESFRFLSTLEFGKLPKSERHVYLRRAFLELRRLEAMNADPTDPFR